MKNVRKIYQMWVGPGETRLAREDLSIKIKSTKIIEVFYTPSVAEIGPADPVRFAQTAGPRCDSIRRLGEQIELLRQCSDSKIANVGPNDA